MNVITVAGNIGKDSELRNMQDGKAILKFSVADSQGRDKPTIWWNCSLFGKRAESLQQYLTKGQQVTVVGRITEREYEGKKYHDIDVSDVALQGGKRDANEAPRQPARQSGTPAPQTSGSGFADMDADIPFADPLRNRALALCM